MINRLHRSPEGEREGQNTGQFNSADALGETLSFTPRTGGASDGALNRAQIVFSKHYRHENNFIEWSLDPQSVAFMEEYWRFTAGGDEYKQYGFDRSADREWSTLNKDGLKMICKKLDITNFGDLKVAKYFEHYMSGITPTHDLICQMWFLTDGEQHYPFYLSSGHLGDSQKCVSAFHHYAKKFIVGETDVNTHVKPSAKDLANVMISLSQMAEKKHTRLLELEFPADELFTLLKEKGVYPFELYENLLREDLFMVNNITEGDTIGFKLTPIGAMMLYMCNPNR